MAASIDTYVSTGEGRISSPVVAGLEQAWSEIRARHGEVPPAVIVVGAGSASSGRSVLRLGHFASMRWHVGRERLAEVFVGGEGLSREPAEVLGTLLHEAAHALAEVRGVKDTSRQGRWHNTRFKALAEELGIEVTKDPRIGWSPTAVPDRTRVAYADAIRALGEVLRLYRDSETREVGSGKSGPPPCGCGCGRRIRVAASVLSVGPILCTVCETEFAPEE